jgi:hypothetical protein
MMAAVPSRQVQTLTGSPKKDPKILLEEAVTAAIHDYEKECGKLVIGICLTRIDRRLLDVSAMIIPQANGRKTRLAWAATV